MALRTHLSTSSIDTSASQIEDWDRSLILDSSPERPTRSTTATPTLSARNSILFPATPSSPESKQNSFGRRDKRSLSELLRLHTEKGTDDDNTFSQEEALRVADVLGQWINASSSPYESEDDFFSRSQDDSAVPSKKPSTDARPRGQSESANSGNFSRS